MQASARSWARVRVVLAAAMPFAVIAAASASAQPVAHAAGSCNLAGKYTSLGPTYVEQLAVSRTSCATGVDVIKAYNHCRLKAGGAKGYCHATVLGFRCSEKRSPGPVQFIGSVHCTKGRELVTFSYSENT